MKLILGLDAGKMCIRDSVWASSSVSKAKVRALLPSPSQAARGSSQASSALASLLPDVYKRQV